MRYFTPDHTESTGGGTKQVPTGMDNDPTADEEVIDQQAGEEYPKPVETPDEQEQQGKLAPDNLADSIAYALDGSGPGPTNEQPNVEGHKVITEGITGANLDEEEENLRKGLEKL